jgi:hypothetical protein
MNLPDILGFVAICTIAFLVFLIPLVVIVYVTWRVKAASKSGNPGDVREALKRTVFYSQESDEFWNEQVGSVIKDLGTYRYVSYLWSDQGWTKYTVFLTQATAGKQLLFEWRSGGGEQTLFTLSGRACRRIADIIRSDEAGFAYQAAFYDRPFEPLEQTWADRLKRELIGQFHFQPLKEYGLIDERSINYPRSKLGPEAWQQTIHAYLGKKRGEFLFVLKEKTISISQVEQWYVFDAAGRETLRKVLQNV